TGPLPSACSGRRAPGSPSRPRPAGRGHRPPAGGGRLPSPSPCPPPSYPAPSCPAAPCRARPGVFSSSGAVGPRPGFLRAPGRPRPAPPRGAPRSAASAARAGSWPLLLLLRSLFLLFGVVHLFLVAVLGRPGELLQEVGDFFLLLADLLKLFLLPGREV